MNLSESTFEDIDFQMPPHTLYDDCLYQFFGICFVNSSMLSHLLTVITDFLNGGNDRPRVWLV